MRSCISAIGTANPKNSISQKDSYQFMSKAFGLQEHHAAKLENIHTNSGIERRFSVIPDFSANDFTQNTFFGTSPDLEPFPDTAKRLKLYEKEAIAIAVNAVNNCLENLDTNFKASITHLITVSCTGMYAPGLDIDLVEQLQLNRSVERTCINFMGCYGAVNALKAADYVCRSNPEAKVLVVSVELCSLHFQKTNSIDNWVANALFADGAAAAIIENTANRSGKGTCLELEAFYSEFMYEARNEMAWYIGNTGFEMKLTGKVPKQVKQHIKRIAENLLNKAGLQFDEMAAFAVHPGGRKILEAAEEALELPEEANQFSYEVLKDYGNMSSATILFVLQKQLYSTKAIESGNIMSFAFGPGLTVESMILKKTVPA
ncbi:3-oxoacyl-[acyl-carrier-protein] synthase III C-terminal domain-containing protein [uncultured Mucilaginibacter sp.]|uniref:type III polyketide synthase n=1 Tax=uncultured Mucilaginibacter sp. TaxID=797541 RepID=UPI0026118032|nr:3-oxoacyl-[acyl-carrier-protein] synthase III C-terminal domain-containing protein [uncultured Mucilaginibacter sp.]